MVDVPVSAATAATAVAAAAGLNYRMVGLRDGVQRRDVRGRQREGPEVQILLRVVLNLRDVASRAHGDRAAALDDPPQAYLGCADFVGSRDLCDGRVAERAAGGEQRTCQAIWQVVAS